MNSDLDKLKYDLKSISAANSRLMDLESINRDGNRINITSTAVNSWLVQQQKQRQRLMRRLVRQRQWLMQQRLYRLKFT